MSDTTEWPRFAAEHAASVESIHVLETVVELRLRGRDALLLFRVEVFRWIPPPTEHARYARVTRWDGHRWVEEGDTAWAEMMFGGDRADADAMAQAIGRALIARHCPASPPGAAP